MYAMYIMDMAILCAAAIYAARLQIIVNPPYGIVFDINLKHEYEKAYLKKK